jgi:hypothetical protein
MAVVSQSSNGRRPILLEPERRRRVLLPRLMVLCRVTEIPVDTGYELSAVVSRQEPLRLIDCMECGQDHTWTIEDAFLE